MKRTMILLWLLAACGFAVTHVLADPVTITVTEKPRQTFVAFGTSLTNNNGDFQKLPPDVRDRVSSAVWKDLDFKILRLWFSPGHFRHEGLAEFKRCYLDSGVIDSAKKFGCTTLLLAPGDVPSNFAAAKADGEAFAWCTDDGVVAYAKLLADAIAKLADAGVKIDATGVLNEPNDRPVRFTAKQWPVVVRTLRAELDSRGLKAVAIVAPEAASADKWAEDCFDAIAGDKTAWAALGGVATHSYNMAVTRTLLRKSQGKPYWQTESSTTGPEDDDAAGFINAASTGARVLSDLNHGVTHWLWFIGYEQTWPPDDGVRLIRFDARKPDGAVYFFRKYYVMQQLSQAFRPGAAVYPCEIAPEKSTTFTYGRKPALLLAACKNTDGTWAVGVQNYTSERFAGLKGWDRSQAGPEAGQTFDVTIHLPALDDVASATFAVRRTNEKQLNADAGTVQVRKGKVTVQISPLELVTLRAVR